MFIWVFSLFIALKFYWTKRNLCVTWKYFSKMWWSTLQLIGTKQFSVLVIAQIIYLVGRCTAPWCCNQEVAATSRPQAPSRSRPMHVAKMFISHLALRNQIPVQSVGQRQMDNDIENCNWFDILSLGCQLFMTEGNIVEYHLRKITWNASVKTP